jgi:hypothetical protein
MRRLERKSSTLSAPCPSAGGKREHRTGKHEKSLSYWSLWATTLARQWWKSRPTRTPALSCVAG